MTTVNRPNRDAFRKAVDIYIDAMRPFIVRNLRTIRGAKVEDLVERSLNDGQIWRFRQAVRNNHNNVEASIDFAYFPLIVGEYWREVFSAQFDNNLSARNAMWQIKDARDKAEHRGKLDMDCDLVNARLYDISDMLGRIRNQDAKSAVVGIKEQLCNRPIPSIPEPNVLPRSAESRVLVVAAKRAWPTYERLGIYRCQPRRSFQPSGYIAFYTAGEIKPCAPKIESVIESIDMMRPEEIKELNGPQRDLAGELCNRIKRENLSHEFSGKRKLMFLSGPDDSDTVKLSGPIANDKRGKNGNLRRSHMATDTQT